MPLLKKAALLGAVLDGLTVAEWSVDGVSGRHPYKVLTTGPQGQEALILHVWNVTHGGRGRSRDEYRIQVTGLNALVFEKGWRTILLGVAEVGGASVLVAFDPSKHAAFGASPSIQVSEGTLVRAARGGFAFEQKQVARAKTEVVVAFRPQLVDQYLLSIQQNYHSEDVRIPASEGSAIASLDFSTRELSKEVLDRIPPDRRRVLRQAFVKSRDQQFREKVLYVYGHRCAVCGVQAGLVQGCHIVAVKEEGLDDVRNGIALCAIHHYAYDRGLIGINPDYTIRMNQRMVQELRAARLDGELDSFVRSARVGERIHLPADAGYYPHADKLRRHLERFQLA